MKTILKTGLAVAFALGLAGTALAQSRTPLTVYTAVENDQLEPFKQAIEAAIPEVEVVWVRDSTGVITARFLAEAENPQADIILGLALSSLLMFDERGLLESYAPAGLGDLREKFRDTRGEPTWHGMDAYVGVVCFNTAEASAAGIEQPASWQDLLKPEFKDKLVMPHPASSGTGYLMVGAWLQMMGEEAGWAFMDGLHENIAAYLHSGSAPCVQAARGERVAGVALDMRGVYERAQGAPLEVVVPSEGTGWEMEATAIVKGTSNLELAKKVADWGASQAANEVYSQTYAVVAHPAVQNNPEGYPENMESKLIDNDFAWMAENRERILAEWSSRYESKAAPKN